ncbi:hypothetical protein K4F52_008971 [Lecanicillium sp. MT-2017a]|nr:hypothetical protein K4F52_008971 [Lecanicillium sp. MT-2017a]
MQFTIVALLTLAATVMAVPRGSIVDRQVLVEAPAMTDREGNVIPFDADTVNQPNLEAGL